MTDQQQKNRTLSASRPPKRKPENPIDAAVTSWRTNLPAELSDTQTQLVDSVVSGVPRRWVVYPPMVLLPAGNSEAKWWAIAESADPMMKDERDRLWRLIIHKISNREGKGALSHLAVNSGIPSHYSSSQGVDDADKRTLESENILRTPSGLVMLYGDFGPSLPPSYMPTEQDFEEAFWVSTKQSGITQVWAPRYTMFSRGNVKEKARLLDFHRSSEFGTRTLDHDILSNNTAVDLYAGIGYFVFSYVKLGLKKVFGWELNPWSVEGMRRGAIANGWTINIVRHQESLVSGSENITVLTENNEFALERLRGLKPSCLDKVIHVNCGLLPTSVLTWRMASEIMAGNGWLHLHENFAIEDVQTRKAEIEKTFQSWLVERDDSRTSKVEHVELVKTFAPGVWHCVFDVSISVGAVDLTTGERKLEM